MKVTAKKPCVSAVYEVVDEGSRYYTAKDGCGFLVALAKADYEPVQEFEDVTGIYDGDEAMGALHSSIYKLTRHKVSKLNKQIKAYAYLLEREKA